MRTLAEVCYHLRGMEGPVPFLSVSADAWESIRDEVLYELDEVHCMPDFPSPNFLVMGVPIIACGRA